MNGQVALADEDHNLWVFLARRGVEVYALDYRTAFPPSSGVSDLGFMQDWTVDAFTEDIRAAAALARKESGRAKLFVSGFSRGAFFAYAYAKNAPRLKPDTKSFARPLSLRARAAAARMSSVKASTVQSAMKPRSLTPLLGGNAVR